MKLLTALILFLFVSFSINSQEFKFETESINYGKVSKGANGERVFVFTNIGDAPLIIKNIQSSCGCTVPKKPEKPIMPGEKGKIEVSYDTKRLGGFSKNINIFSNAKTARKKVKIKGYVTKGILPEKEKSMLSDS
mgnify:CR=1 FL=1